MLFFFVFQLFAALFHFSLCSKLCSSITWTSSKDYFTFIKWQESLKTAYWSSSYTKANLKFHHELALHLTMVNADLNTLLIWSPIPFVFLNDLLLGSLLEGKVTENIETFQVIKKSCSMMETMKNANQWSVICFFVCLLFLFFKKSFIFYG